MALSPSSNNTVLFILEVPLYQTPPLNNTLTRRPTRKGNEPVVVEQEEEEEEDEEEDDDDDDDEDADEDKSEET